MAQPDQQQVMTEAAGVQSTPATNGTTAAPAEHVHCWHWGAKFVGDPPVAEGNCCWDQASIKVAPDSPLITGQHGPYAD